MMIVTPEITLPINASDAQPNIYMPRDFLVKLDPKDVPQPLPSRKGKK